MPITFEKVLPLKNCPLFENASENALFDLSGASIEITYKKNDIVLSKNDTINDLYIILSGKLTYTPENALDVEITQRQYLGYTSIFSPTAMPYTITASEKTIVLKITAEKLYQLIALHPSIATGFIGIISKQLRQKAKII